MTERTPDINRNIPWPEAAQQLARLAAQRGKQLGSAEQLQQLDAVCATISALCDTHPSPAAVKSHKLLQLLGTVLSTVLDQGNHRKWRQAAYATRVCYLMHTLHELVCMAGAEPGVGAPGDVATRVSSQLSESGVLPKLAVAVQEVAVVLSAANKQPVDAPGGPSRQDQHHPAVAQLAAIMLQLLASVLLSWPGGVLGSAAAAPLAAPAAQLAHAAVSTYQQRWEACSGEEHQQQLQIAVQQELTVCVMLSDLLMRLFHEADWKKVGQQPHSLQLLQAPQYHKLMLLQLAVRAQQLHEQTADNSASTSSTSLNSSLPVSAIAGTSSSSSSSSSSCGTSRSTSSRSSSGQQPMQQQPASGVTAAGRKQQLPYQLPYQQQLWLSLGLPQQLLTVTCGAVSLSEPCQDFLATCSVLSVCMEELVVANPGRFASHDELSPSQMAVARLHQLVPMLLLETAAAFISNNSLVISCANTATQSVNCWKLVLDEQLATKTDMQGQSGAAAHGASTAAAQLPVRKLQQLVLTLFKQLLQQPQAARKPERQQQQHANTACSSSQRIAEQQQQQPGDSTDVMDALTALMEVLHSVLHLPIEFHLSWQGVSAVLQTFVRNLVSSRSSNDMQTINQEAAVQAIDVVNFIDSLCIQYGSQEPGQLVRAAAAAAAGSAEQLQLFGLLVSTLKLWHSHMLHHMGARGEEVLPSEDSVLYIHNLGLAAHHMLAGLAPAAAGAPAAGSNAAGVGAVQPAAVPWLVLQARCLYLAGALLHKHAAWQPTGGPDDPGPCIHTSNAGYAAQRVIPAMNACVGGAAEIACRLATYLRSCSAPAAESRSSEQAGNAGNADTGTSAASSSSSSRRLQAGVLTPQAGILTPQAGVLTPQAGVLTPQAGVLTPQAGVLTPQAGVLTPQAGVLTPQAGVLTPQAGVLTPQAGVLTPQAGVLTPQAGVLTPQAGVLTPQAGVLTPPPAATPAATTSGPGTVGCQLQQELLSLTDELLQGAGVTRVAVVTLTAFEQQWRQSGAQVLNMLQQLQQGPGRLKELSCQLTAFGAALSTQLPTLCCNNPGCTNMAMASEQQLVGGKSCICAGCQVARYCGKACQTAHWKQHRPVCRRISKR